MTPLQKQRARGKVKGALKAGALIRPAICSRCGTDPGLGRDGRSRIHAHHHRGYDHPLDVEWLCYKCHVDDDPRASGERNGQSKLTAAAVSIIRSGDDCSRQLAKQFGVSRRTVQLVRAGTHWSTPA